jgi:hypothetical protein
MVIGEYDQNLLTLKGLTHQIELFTVFTLPIRGAKR